MSQEKIKKIHLIYGCVAAVFIVAFGIALILSCLDIYNSGARPYTPESISRHFQNISLLAYTCIALALGGIILGLVLPLDQPKPKAVKDDLAYMEKAKAKATNLTEETAMAANKEQRFRLVLRIGTAFIFAALMVYPAMYFMDGSHFSIDALNDDIRRAVLIALIPALMGLMLCFICSELQRKSISRETEIYKRAAGPKANNASPADRKKINTLPIVRCAILAVAVCFIVLGIFNGGMKDVFDKAVAICTECIGLG